MAKRKQPPPPPPPGHRYPSEVDTSSDEDEAQFVAKPVAPAPTPQARNPKPATPAPQARNPQPAEQEEDESDSDYGTESEDEPEPAVKRTPAKITPAKTVSSPPPPSKKPVEESEDDSSSSEDDSSEEEEREKVKSPVKSPVKTPVKTPYTEPEKKKAKLSEPDRSPSKKSMSTMARIWTEDDEIVLLRALTDYHTKHGKLPPTKDYTSFLSTISGSISFPVTNRQLVNKMRGLKNFYRKMAKKKGSDFKFTRPHEKTVFELSSKLFQDSVKPQKKDGNGHVSSDNDDDDDDDDTDHANGATANGAAMANGGPANSGSGNHDDDGGGDASGSRSSIVYLKSLVEEMIAKQQFDAWLTSSDVINLIEESKVRGFEAKAKALRIEALKLRAREDKLKSEVFGLLAKGMSNE